MLIRWRRRRAAALVIVAASLLARAGAFGEDGDEAPVAAKGVAHPDPKMEERCAPLRPATYRKIGDTWYTGAVRCSKTRQTTSEQYMKEIAYPYLEEARVSPSDIGNLGCVARAPPEQTCYVAYTGEKYEKTRCSRGSCLFNTTRTRGVMRDGFGSQHMTMFRVLELAIEANCTFVHRPLMHVEHFRDEWRGARTCEAFFGFGDGCPQVSTFAKVHTDDMPTAKRIWSLDTMIVKEREGLELVPADGAEAAAVRNGDLAYFEQDFPGVEHGHRALMLSDDDLKKIRYRHIVHIPHNRSTTNIVDRFRRICEPGMLCTLAWPAARTLAKYTADFSWSAQLLARLHARRRYELYMDGRKEMPSGWDRQVHLTFHVRRGDVVQLLAQGNSSAAANERRFASQMSVVMAMKSVLTDVALFEYESAAEALSKGEPPPEVLPVALHIMSQGETRDFAFIIASEQDIVKEAEADAFRQISTVRLAQACKDRGPMPAPLARRPLRVDITYELNVQPLRTIARMANSDILVGLSESQFVFYAARLLSLRRSFFINWTSYKSAAAKSKVLHRKQQCSIRAVLHLARKRILAAQERQSAAKAEAGAAMYFYNEEE